LKEQETERIENLAAFHQHFKLTPQQYINAYFLNVAGKKTIHAAEASF